MTFLIDEPLLELSAAAQKAADAAGVAFAVVGESVEVVNSSAYLHDEAAILDAEELCDARAALIEDGIFASEDWIATYVADGWEQDATLRAAVKYGWALAHLEAVVSDSPPERGVAWLVADGFETTTSTELKFLRAELRRRSLQVRWIAPCTPARFEPGVDYTGNPGGFAKWLNSFPADDSIGVMFSNAADKFSILPLIGGRGDFPLALEFRGVAWLEALRLVARLEPALLRDLLFAAQEHFVLDKGPHALSTGEEDVRSLPSVEDLQLEAMFLDDSRGRQLLHVTAQSLVRDEERRGRLSTFFARHSEELEKLLVAIFRRHLDALNPA